MVAGVDEVGRGSLAGPVVAAAVVLPPQLQIEGLRDSKQLSPQRRLFWSIKIKQAALAIGLGWVQPHDIDEHGLTWAVRRSGLLALEQLNRNLDLVILDGKHNYLKDYYNCEAHIKADEHCLPVACAGVIAKVARDSYMRVQAQKYPDYGFERNAGYGTATHMAALADKISPIHRQSFKPIKSSNEF